MSKKATFSHAGIGKTPKAGDFEADLAALGWSKAELARRIDVSASTISRWKSSPPKVVAEYLSLLAHLRSLVE